VNRERIIVGLVALAFLVLVVWIARNTEWEIKAVRTPPRGEALTNPFYVPQRIVEELGATSEWNRTLIDPPPTDTVLVLHNWNWDLIEARRDALEAWVEAGGRLLVDSRLFGNSDAFEQWSGIRQEVRDHRRASEHGQDEEVGEGEEQPQQENRKPQLPERCRDLILNSGASDSDPQRSRYFGCGFNGFQYLVTDRPSEWLLEDEFGGQVVRIRIGAGSITWYNAELTSERFFRFASSPPLLDGENAAIFAHAVQLRRGDHVVFATEMQRASLLTLIWRHGAPAVALFLLLVALAVWRGSLRMGPLSPPAELARRSLAEQIRGTGRFIFKTNGGRSLHAAVVRALFEAARRHIPGFDRLAPRQRIEAIARIAKLDADTLAHAVDAGDLRRPAEFRRVIALLESVRRRVAAYDARSTANQQTNRPDHSPSQAHTYGHHEQRAEWRGEQ
jgi:hypothetical protein